MKTIEMLENISAFFSSVQPLIELVSVQYMVMSSPEVYEHIDKQHTVRGRLAVKHAQ